MATFDGLVVRIIDELSVGARLQEGDLPRPVSRTEVEREILKACEFYSTARFWFNEASGTLTTSSSLATYSWPTDLMEIDSVTLTQSGSRYSLRQVGYAQMEALDSGQDFGPPTSFAMWAEQLRLYPVPAATYTIAIAYQKRLPTLSVTSDTNAWTTVAQDLIASRVISRISAGRLRDPQRAQIFQLIEMQELQRLLQQNEKTASSGRIASSE